MAAKLDPFVDVLLREHGDQLYLLPDEPVTLVKDGKPRKVSKQPLPDQHIYALRVEVAPSESANHIDTGTETEFEYIADRGMVRVRIVPEMGRLTAVVSPKPRPAQAEPSVAAPAPATAPAPAPAPAPPVAAAPPKSKTARAPAAGAGAPAPAAQRTPPVAEAPAPAADKRGAAPPAGLPADFAPGQYQAAERTLGDLLRALVQSKSSDLHLRVGEPPLFRTHGEMTRQSGGPLTIDQLELMLLAIMPERNRTEWRDTGDSDFAYEIAGLARFRVDPDIVLVGEMRDLETIAIAIETAETGHLVFGTLHTTTASSTVDRIIDQFPADRQSQIRVMLSESLKGVISQTLCKKIGGGRVAAREILLTTPAVSNLIREGKTFQIPSIMQTSKQLGMVTLNDALLDLVEKKEISADEAYVKSVEKAGLQASLKAKGHKLTITA